MFENFVFLIVSLRCNYEELHSRWTTTTLCAFLLLHVFDNHLPGQWAEQ